MSRRGRLFAGLSVSLVLATALGACGGSSRKPAPAAVPVTTLLARCKATLDATQAVHFRLTSTGVSSSGTNIVGGNGDLARPGQLIGSFTVQEDGLQTSVSVIATGGAFYARLPFVPGYTKVDPSSLGLGNPAELLDPKNGVSGLLVEAAPNAEKVGTLRIQGELVVEVRGTVPGDKVPVLPNKDPSRPVTLLFSINPVSYQLRQVSLTGPFTSTSAPTTYTVTLTNYGEHVTVTAPKT